MLERKNSIKYNLNLLNNEIGEQVEKDYLDLKELNEIANNYFNGNVYLARRILQYRGIILRNRSEVKQLIDKKYINTNYNNRKYKVNCYYFDTWSNNMAYILGFIAADGCITRDVLKIGIQYDDINLLEDIKKQLDFSGNITTRDIKLKNKIYKAAYLDIYSKYMVDRLKILGLCEQKSLQLSRFDFIPQEYEMDFVRGYFDGDGSVGGQYPQNTRTLQIRFRISSGSKEILEYMNDVLTKRGYKRKQITTDSKKRQSNFYSLAYSTRESLKLYNDLYYKNCMCLQRKYHKFNELIEQRKIDIANSIGYIKIT